MQDQGSPGNAHHADPCHARGEFDDLLRQIETEAVPERLLDLARKLQTALTERRRQESSVGG